jgi:acyl-CoA thioester hydrolase
VTPFERRITAAAEDIDELGHVNNAVWVRWIQDIATAHWYAAAPPEHRDAYHLGRVRHEIDYLRAVARRDGDRPHLGREPPRAPASTGTWSSSAPTESAGAGEDDLGGLDKESGRPIRVPPEVIAPFL